MNAVQRAEESAQADIRSALRRRRRALGLTQEQAARLLAMPRLTYHRIETGARHIKFAELGQICLALHCHIEDLVRDKQLAAAYATFAQAILGEHPTGGSRVEIDHRAREARRRQERLATNRWESRW